MATPHATRHKRTRLADAVRRRYASAISVAMLALTLFSFSDNLLTDVGQPSNGDARFVVHGLFCLAWMAMLALQANLIRRGNIRLHRALGMAGIIVALGVTLSTLYVFVSVWKGWDAMPVWAKANRVLLPSFSLLALLAFLSRKRPDRHRRLMLVATFYMLEPVLSRSFDPLMPWLDHLPAAEVDRTWWIFFILSWHATFLSLFAYDWCAARRIHPVTIAGYAWFCLIWTMIWFV